MSADMTALGLLILAITPAHRCSNHFLTPNPTGAVAELSKVVLWEGRRGVLT